MGGLKIHGSMISTATMRAAATIYEKDLEFELVPVDMGAGHHKKEPFISLNPFGQVPVFEDGNVTLFESRAITQYIASTHESGTPLLCNNDSKKLPLIYLWKEVEAHQFDPAASKLVYELALKPYFKMQTDEAVVEEYEGKLGKVLDVYEARLSQSKYLACDCFTLADLHHLPTIHYLLNTRAKKLFESRAHVHAWVVSITTRPAWLKVLALQKPH